MLEEAIAVRAAYHADSKGWKEFVSSLDGGAGQKDDAEAFKNMVRMGGLGGGR